MDVRCQVTASVYVTVLKWCFPFPYTNVISAFSDSTLSADALMYGNLFQPDSWAIHAMQEN